MSGDLQPRCGLEGMQLQLSDETLPDYLRSLGLLGPGEGASVEPAGDGNINWVRRVRVSAEGPSGGRSWVVKQARPALERFPQYEVSTERIVFEHRYGERARPFDREGVLPRVHAFDAEARVLILEDLGAAERMDGALARGAELSEAAGRIGAFLGRVHAGTRDRGLANAFANHAMRRLHGDHIFLLPLRENDFPIAAGVAPRARALREDAELVRIADAAYARYLEPSGALVHGDVQAGNVLLDASGPKLLDAEIAHVGDPAFDVGSFVAHLVLPAAAEGHLAAALPAVEAAWSAYRHAHGPGAPAFRDALRYAGLELLRRSIGAARVAAVENADAGFAVLARAETWIKRPPADLASLRRS